MNREDNNWRQYRGAYERFQMQPAKISTTAFVQLYVFHLLHNNNQMYGYEMIKEIGDRFAGTTGWSPSPSVMYPVLRRMTEQGWLTFEKEDPMSNSRKFYRLTQKGYERYQEQRAEFREKFNSSIVLLTRAYEDLYGEYEG